MRYLNCFMCFLAFAAIVNLIVSFLDIFGGRGFVVLFLIAGGFAVCKLVETFDGETK